MKLQHIVIPWEIDELEHVRQNGLRIGHHVFILDILYRKITGLMPMLHDSTFLHERVSEVR